MFGDKWPPIDDDEFIRRCPPGVRRDVALRVRLIIAEQLGIDKNVHISVEQVASFRVAFKCQAYEIK